MVSLDELYLFEESDDDGSGSGSPGKYVVSAVDVGFGNFPPTGIKSLGNFVLLNVFVPRVFNYKGGKLIASFWRSKS